VATPQERSEFIYQALKGRHKVFRPYRACDEDNDWNPAAMPQAIILSPLQGFSKKLLRIKLPLTFSHRSCRSGARMNL
jgi:hypothetical protein